MSRNPFIEQAWRWLERELGYWAAAGKVAHFWWRDDDASDHTAALERLLQTTAVYQVPLALAVIPATIKPALIERLQQQSLISDAIVENIDFFMAFTENYAILNDCPMFWDPKLLEAGHYVTRFYPELPTRFGGTRSSDEIITDLRLGKQILAQNFGAHFVPALVPPWNRIDANTVAHLPDLGFSGISAMKRRTVAHPAPGLLEVNAHLDPINWRHNGGFIGLYPAIAILIQHLIAKRSGYRDGAEPTGILSHHLVQNEAVWRFLDNLLLFLSQQPAVHFVDAREIWQ